MSFDSFIKYLQELLTMVDPYKVASVMQAKAALAATAALALNSDKTDPVTLRTMNAAMLRFDEFAKMRDEFAGVPGDYELNQKKRKRLGLMIRPSC